MDEMLVFIMVGAVILTLGIILWITSRRQRESALDQMRAKSAVPSLREPNTMVRVRERMKLDLKDAKELVDNIK